MPKEKQVLIITGYARSGKDTTADYLSKKYGFKKIVFTDFMKKELKKRKLAPTKENMNKYGQQFRDELGKDYLVRAVLAESEKHPKVAICSVKPIWEYEAIMQKYPQTKMILVTAPKELRFTRRPADSPSEFEAFLQRDKNDEKWYALKTIFSKKDFEITNDGTLGDLYKKIDEVMGKINAAK